MSKIYPMSTRAEVERICAANAAGAAALPLELAADLLHRLAEHRPAGRQTAGR
jgi:hypothetical protein